MFPPDQEFLTLLIEKSPENKVGRDSLGIVIDTCMCQEESLCPQYIFSLFGTRHEVPSEGGIRQG